MMNPRSGFAMVKTRFFYVFLGVLVGIMLSASFALADNPISLVVNGQQITCDVPPQMINGRVMIPARFLAEALGATVQWDNSSNSVIVTSNGSANSSDSSSTTKSQPSQQNSTSNSTTTNNTSTTQTDTQGYNNFKNMFTIGKKTIDGSGQAVLAQATYNGNEDINTFWADWNSINNRKTYAGKLGQAIQAINPNYPLSLDFYFNNIHLGYVLAYTNNTQLSDFISTLPGTQSDINQ